MGEIYHKRVIPIMIKYIYSFEKLEAWQNANKLCKSIYQITGKFPHSEMNGLTNQMRRAAISIASNIAEGCGRKLGKEQARFYQYSLSSSYELLNQLIIANEIELVDSYSYLETRKYIQIITFQINSLSKYTLSASAKTN